MSFLVPSPKEVPLSLFYFAWRKVKAHLLKAIAVYDPVELAVFENSLELNLKRLKLDFEAGNYETTSLLTLAFPKGDRGEARPMSLVSVRDQVAWVTVVLALGECLDTNPLPPSGQTPEQWMVRWSYAGRLYRRFVPPIHLGVEDVEDRSMWHRGPINLSSEHLYDQVPYAWRRYREDLSAWAESTVNRYGQAYYGRTDISKFYPSLLMSHVIAALRKRMRAYRSELDKAWGPLLERLGYFKVEHPQMKPEEVAILYKKGNPQGAGVLPTGLIAAPFLANVFLTDIDRKLDVICKLGRNVVHVARYMDDFTVIAESPDGVRHIILELRRLLRPYGIQLSKEKTSPSYSILKATGASFPEDNRLTGVSLRPFMTRTLDRLSVLGHQEITALKPDALKLFQENMVDLVDTQIAENEIRTDTRISFGIWRLHRLAIVCHQRGDIKRADDIVERMIQVCNTRREKIPLLKAGISVLLRTERYSRLASFLVEDVLGGPRWNRLGGDFVRGYALFTLASIVRDARNEHLNAPECISKLGEALDGVYGERRASWYEQMGLSYVLSTLNLKRSYCHVGETQSELGPLRLHQALYDITTTSRTAVDVAKAGLHGFRHLTAHDVLHGIQTLALEGLALFRDQQAANIKSRVESLWAGQMSHGSIQSAAVLRVARLFPGYVPVPAAALMLGQGPLSAGYGEVALNEVVDGISWREAVTVWIDFHVDRGNWDLLSQFGRELWSMRKLPPVRERLHYLIWRNRAHQGRSKRILLADWIRQNERLPEQHVCQAVMELARFAQKGAPRYWQPGRFHPGSISVPRDMKAGQVTAGCFRFERRVSFVDEAYVSPYVYLNASAFNLGLATAAARREAYMCYALGLILLRMLQRVAPAGRPAWGLRKLSGWADVKEVLKWAHFPSTSLASLISGAIQYQRLLYQGLVGWHLSAKAHPIDGTPVTTLTRYISDIEAHLNLLGQNSYPGENLREVILIDVDLLRDKVPTVVSEAGTVIVSQMETIDPGQNQHSRFRRSVIDHPRLWRSMSRALDEAELIRRQGEQGPLFVTFPELCVPHSFRERLSYWANDLQCVIIAGNEFGPPWTPDEAGDDLVNEGCIIIPERHTGNPAKARATVVPIQKWSAAPFETSLAHDAGYEWAAGNRLYLFRSKWAGNFAVVICFDFMNLSVQPLLQGRIETLFVVALNKDVSAFQSFAESTSRLLACNVVICNSAFYGGSVVYSPEREPHRRERLVLRGNGIESAISVPILIRPHWEHQRKRPVRGVDHFPLVPDFGFRGVVLPAQQAAAALDPNSADDTE